MISGPVPVHQQERQNRLYKVIALASVLIMLFLLVISYRNLVGYIDRNEDIRRSHELIRELEQVLSIVKDAEMGAHGYFFSNDINLLRPYDQATRILPEHLDGLSALFEADTVSREGFNGFRSQVALKMRSLDQLIMDRRGDTAPIGRPDSTLLLESKERMDELRRRQLTLMDRYARILHHQERDDRDLKWTGPGMLATYASLALLCIALLFVRMFRAIERAQGAERLAVSTAAELDQEARTRELAERSLKRVLDSSPSGIMAFRSVRDERGSIVDFECTRMNEAAENIFHKKAEDMLHQGMMEIHPENRRSPLFNRYVSIVESGEPLKTETEFTFEGQVSTLSISAVRLLDGLVITFSDITEAKRQAILVQEGERLSVTGRFARMVGHEVRNPLTNIQLALDQIQSEGLGQPGQQIYLDILRRNSQRIGQLITEMLHTSRPLEVKMIPGPVNAVLSDALARVQDRCELRKAVCTSELQAGLEDIPIDKATLTVAFTNLLVNALEAMDEGKGRLVISSERVKDRIKVTVRDNGKGMNAEDRERIFQPFFSGRKGGMGLGLTEARNIFNAHGVLLTVESEPGKGTAFNMLFPA